MEPVGDDQTKRYFFICRAVYGKAVGETAREGCLVKAGACPVSEQ